MQKLRLRSTVLFLLASLAGVAAAQSDNPWNGVYLGANAGEARNTACVSGTLSGAAIATPSNSQICPGGGVVAGGVQIGDNFQYQKLVVGFEAELDMAGAKSRSVSMSSAGAQPPAGTYVLSGKLDPNLFGIFSARIGFASRQWQPYLKIGAIVAGGSHDSTLSYTPVGALKPLVSFNGGKNFSTAGWVAGGGVEYGLNGPWSFSLEYLSANLGKGSNTTATCSGLAAACAQFSGASFDATHDSFKAGIVRIGFTYWFNYW
jgi:outer membrane immunogenic protein